MLSTRYSNMLLIEFLNLLSSNAPTISSSNNLLFTMGCAIRLVQQVDPGVREIMGIKLKHAVVIFDEVGGIQLSCTALPPQSCQTICNYTALVTLLVYVSV